jgi:hypothetical protein
MSNEILKQIVDERRKIAELYSRVEKLEQLIQERQQAQPAQPQPQPQLQRRRRKTGMEILHEQKVLYESKLERLRDKDRFFDYLRRQGAVIIEAQGERIAVDPEFWNEFVERLESITTPDEREVGKYLSPIEKELFTKLRASQLVIFDGKTRNWKIMIGSP